MNPRSIGFHLLIIPISLILTGCATITTNVYHSPTSLVPPISSSLLVLPPDVIIYLKNAGGNNEPRADWSEQVQSNLNEAITEYMFENGIRVVSYPSERIVDEHIDVLRQANVMMDALELSQQQGEGTTGIGGDRLYALGKGSRDQLSGFGADYVLITSLRTEVASGGRQALAVLSALGGVAISTSSARFRAGIFDLRDGQVTWANFDLEALSDIGNVVKADREEWSRAVQHILSEFPL